MKRGFGFAHISPDLHRNLFSLATKQVFALPLGTECVLHARNPNNEPWTANNHGLNTPPPPYTSTFTSHQPDICPMRI